MPNALFGLLWLPMQLGNLVVGTAAGLIVALVAGDRTVALGVLLAMVLKLVTERVVRREMAARSRSVSGPVRARRGPCSAAATCRCRARASRRDT